MSEENAFLDAICRDPLNLQARLEFADWLDERDDLRGEFIRTQVELAKTPEPAIKTPGGFLQLNDEEYNWFNCAAKEPCQFDPVKKTGELCRYHFLRHREQELLQRADEWLGPYNQLVTEIQQPPSTWWPAFKWELCPSFNWEWRRGFVEVVSCTCQNWIAHGPAIVRQQPILEVRLTDFGVPPIANWYSLPWLQVREATRTRFVKEGDTLEWARHQAGLPTLKPVSSKAD